ncbi:MAG: hypothetical protein ACK4WH_02520 [Phycisphaerales bacterium]
MSADPKAARTRPASPLLEDLLAELTWPVLLRAGRLATRPARVGIALMFLLALGLLLSLADRLDGSTDKSNVLLVHGERTVTSARSFAIGVWAGDYSRAGTHLADAFINHPWSCVSAAPLATILFVPLLLLLAAITGGAISRSAATELAWSRPIPWPTALALGLSRWRSLLGALLLPLLLTWLGAVSLSIAGWVVFSTGAASVLGGLLWLLFLLVGLALTLLMIGVALGHWMLVPSVTCEGADAIDATQHTLALVFARPFRLVGYLLVLLVQGLVLAAVVGVVVAGAIAIARSSAAAWLDADHAAILGGADLAAPADAPRPSGRLASTGRGLVRTSTTVFTLAGVAVLVSYAWCAATALFLAMRRVVDGQDVGELWSPGSPGGTLPATSPPPTVAARSSGEAIIDNGPADDR